MFIGFPQIAKTFAKTKSRKKTKAHQLAKEQRDIPVSEFFEQNRHILGFDNPTHSLITAVKEGVDILLGEFFCYLWEERLAEPFSWF